ncbi:hypothetical protein ACQEVY_22305 [Streptomyces sp. CA-288835]|uniref:hypothetical protein n=1 Tax=Streptomyces sp. CA-288835 TaxID=3240069 RepID=UPI003D94AF65
MQLSFIRRLAVACAGAFAVTLGAFTAYAATSAPTAVPAAEAADDLPPFAVEDFSYPNADRILAEKGLKLIKGNGRLLFTECDGSAGLIEVWTRQTPDGRYCFKPDGKGGFLTLEVPDVYALQTTDNPISADLTAAGETATVDVAKNQFKGVGEGVGDAPAVLVELRVTG